MQVSPSEGKADEDITRDELAVERTRLASELADAKRKFMAVAKRKQQEYGKKVLLYYDASSKLHVCMIIKHNTTSPACLSGGTVAYLHC